MGFRIATLLVVSCLIHSEHVYAQSREGFLLKNERSIFSLASASRSPLVALEANATGAIAFFDTNAGRVVRHLRTGGGAVRGLALSPDGELLAVAENKVVSLWRVSTGKQVGKYSSQAYGMQFSPDGATLAINFGLTVTLIETVTGKRRGQLRGDIGFSPYFASCLAYSRDGKLLAVPGKDKSVVVWDVARAQIKRLLAGHKRDVLAVAFGNDHFLASSDGSVRLWNIDTDAGAEKLPGPDVGGAGAPLVFSRDGNFLAGGSGKDIGIWVLPQKKFLGVFMGHEDSVNGLGFAGDGRTVYSVGDHTFRSWTIPRDGNLPRRKFED